MKKKDIIQLVKKLVKEDAYGSATLTTQGSPRTGTVVPTDEYPFSARPKRTATGMMEFQQPKSFDPDTINLVREMLLVADIHHNELVGGYDEVSSYLDKRTGGTIIKFPHFNGPQGRGAMFGKETSDQIDSSKAKAKLAAIKTKQKFQTYVDDFEISDASPAGVYGNIYLWIMFNESSKDYSAPKGGTQSTQFENKQNKTKMKKLKETTYVGKKQDTFLKAKDTQSYQQADSIVKQDIQQKLKDGEPVELNQEGETFGSAGTDKRTGQVIGEILQLIKSTGIDPKDVMEGIGQAFGVSFEFGRAFEGKNDEDDEQDMADVKADIAGMMEGYIKERANSKLIEHMDKHRKKVRLMEGATEKLFKLFNTGKTDAEVRSHYLQMNIDMPEAFISKLRNNWEALRKTKLDLTLADKEAEGFESIQQPKAIAGMEGGEGGEGGMEEEKQLASGLFNEKEVDEGNAFGLAMQKAKAAGEDSFELDGETIKV